MNFKNDMAASGKEAFGMEVCDKVAFGRAEKAEKDLFPADDVSRPDGVLLAGGLHVGASQTAISRGFDALPAFHSPP